MKLYRAYVGGKQVTTVRAYIIISAIVAGHGWRCYHPSHVGNPFTIAYTIILYEFPISEFNYCDESRRFDTSCLAPLHGVRLNYALLIYNNIKWYYITVKPVWYGNLTFMEKCYGPGEPYVVLNTSFPE